ncbi:hypothetical protein [uncultured Schumannella sp.]|uniref:PH-like domain-containing protein n=1 Tax=uncultured Schumannella sp. TaxID=1195956 RepID=UPI0025E362D1|nr:hypothetical protein [uncultured Schumannella sp.]
MDKVLPTLIVVAVLALVFGSLAVAWRARARRHAALGQVETLPAGLGEARDSFDVLYLATTHAEKPLERIALPGLGFRSNATLRIHEAGLELDLGGRSGPAFIPRERMLGAGRANWTIDRASGGDRLVFVRWRLGDGDPGDGELAVDSTFRAADPARLADALLSLVPVSTESDAS